MRFPTPVLNLADPALEPAPTPDPAVATADPPSSPELAPAPTPEPANQERMIPVKVMLERLGEVSAKREASERRAAEAERRAMEAEALAQRLQAGKPGNADPGAPQSPQPPVPRQPEDRQAEIRREAENLRFYEDTVDIRNRGIAQFGAPFMESLNILTAVGATTNDFITDVMAVDKAGAHVVLDAIAKDPEKAVALANMTSRQRIAELTRMTMAAPKIDQSALAPTTQPEPKAPPAPAPKQVSKAPPPPPRIDPGAKQDKPWHEAESDDEWNRNFDQHQAERRKRMGLR